jgi:hypothetical protein
MKKVLGSMIDIMNFKLNVIAWIADKMAIDVTVFLLQEIEPEIPGTEPVCVRKCLLTNWSTVLPFQWRYPTARRGEMGSMLPLIQMVSGSEYDPKAAYHRYKF